MRSIATGTVRRLGVKGEIPGEHGLPKPSVPSVRITPFGMEGDYNRYRTVERQSDPAMAILLLPEEVLAELKSEGWPVRPGDLGENITLAGVPYSALHPEYEIQVGAACLQVSKPCTPCDNLFALPYVGRERGAEFLKATLGRRGWFARVLRGGTVRVGDPVTVAGPVAATAAGPALPDSREL